MAVPIFTFKIRWIHNVLDVNNSCRFFQKNKIFILHQNVITCPTSETTFLLFSFLRLDVTKPSYFSTCHIATTFQDPVKYQWVKSSALLFSTSLWNVTISCKCHFKLTLKKKKNHQLRYIIPAKLTCYKKNTRYKKCMLSLTWVLWWVRCILSSPGKFISTSKLMTTGQSVNPHAFTPRPTASRSIRQLGEMNQCTVRQTPLSLSLHAHS